MSSNLPPLPEPVAHQVVAHGVTAKLAVRADVAEEWADNCRREGAYGASVRTLYTADQMLAYGAASAAAEREACTDTLTACISVVEQSAIGEQRRIGLATLKSAVALLQTRRENE